MPAVYDFDNTIFRGDSTARFCLFLLTRRPGLLRKAPGVARAFLAMKKIGKTAAKQALYKAVLPGLPDLEGAVSDFWAKNFARVKPWYLAQKKPDDVVASASPEFLLRPACKALGVQTLIASVVDPSTGVYTGLNCGGAEKARRVNLLTGGAPFDFYSDSDTDLPTARLARRAFRVRGDRVARWSVTSDR